MGREWNWAKTFRKAGSGAGTGRGVEKQQTTQVAGCMSSVLHFFDLHQLLFATRASSVGVVVPPHHSPPKIAELARGVEAPRNSLELDLSTKASSASAVLDASDDYEIPFGIQVIPRRKASLTAEELEDEENLQVVSSARSSTANVVAKLMGLDVVSNGNDGRSPRTLSDADDKALVSKKQHYHHHSRKKKEQQKMTSQTPPPRHPLQPRNSNVMMACDDARRGTRSLPETPRISFARRSGDSDPRLSVQSNSYINKENVNLNVRGNLSASAMQELKTAFLDYSSSSPYSPSLVLPKKTEKEDSDYRKKTRHIVGEQTNSPSRYAKEIVRQMKDSVVSRRIEKGRSTASRQNQTPPSTSKIKTTPKPKPSPKCKKVSCDRFNERLKQQH